MTAVNIPTLAAAQPQESQGTVQRLISLSARGLVSMFDERTRLFCNKLEKADEGVRQQGTSPRYTAMTLLGLNRLEQTGVRSPIEIAPVLETLLADTGWVDNIGDLGLLIWLCSHLASDRLEDVNDRLDVRGALQRYPDAERGHTMEMAWLLTGLSYWALARPETSQGLKPLATEVYRRLEANQGKHGFFGHSSGKGSLTGRMRGWIGSFADQVYPTYAMALFSKVYGHREAQIRALQCGVAVCEAQGEQGQWWWHYNSRNGRVIDGYPVYSVHQHAMGPMALFLLGDVTGRDFSPWIYRGLEWINGKNELAFNMESAAFNLVWRCFFRTSSRFARYVDAMLSPGAKATPSPKDLKILFECRPYELGWLLYAFAGRAGSGTVR